MRRGPLARAMAATAVIGTASFAASASVAQTPDAVSLIWDGGRMDYRTLDAVIAVRPFEPHLYFAKPASKLINAWRAGVPALVGPEFASREIRRTDDDFLEVADAGGFPVHLQESLRLLERGAVRRDGAGRSDQRRDQGHQEQPGFLNNLRNKCLGHGVTL